MLCHNCPEFSKNRISQFFKGKYLLVRRTSWKGRISVVGMRGKPVSKNYRNWTIRSNCSGSCAIIGLTCCRAYRPWTDLVIRTVQNMTGTTRVICVTAAIDHLLNEMNDFLRLCASCGSTLFASLLGREQTPIEVSVSKAHFIPQTP